MTEGGRISDWPSDRLTGLLGLTHPIIQAPMAGAATPELAAAVSNAGGLGSLGCADLDATAVRAVMAEMRRHTNAAFNLNFFAHGPVESDQDALSRTVDALRPGFDVAETGEPSRDIPLSAPAAFGADMLDVLLSDPPPVVSFHFGLPEGEAVARLRAAGCLVLSTATNVAEAHALEAAGVDAIIAQGWEAGGHRGAFDVETCDVGVGLMALVPQIADAVKVPVIAAGGIADGRGIAAALMLGADAVQIGTAFLACPKSAASPLHRRVLAKARDTATRLTRAHSGRPARAHRTVFIDAMASRDAETLPFPLMYPLSGRLAASNGNPDDPEGRFLLYGQAAGLTRAEPAADLMARLVAETRSRLTATEAEA